MPVKISPKNGKLKICLSIIFVTFYFLGLSFIFVQTAVAADNCSSVYPDGQCVAATTCETGKFEDKTSGRCGAGEICCHQFAAQPNITLAVPIFGYTTATNIAEYIARIYEYFLYVLTPIAIVIMIWAGMRWILAGGDPPKIQEAKKYISSAFAGLTIAILSYFVLSFLGLTSLELPGIQYIPEEKLPPPRGGSGPGGSGKGEFDSKDCPNISGGEVDVTVNFTVYYKPKYDECGDFCSIFPGDPHQAFLCNTAMQCWCPNGNKKNMSITCPAKLDRPLHACADFPAGTPFCTSGAGGSPPQAQHTIAADLYQTKLPADRKGCFAKGCKFTIEGDPNGAITYEMEDTGGQITGLHMDYYAGEGTAAKQLAISQYQGQRIIHLDQASCVSPNSTNPPKSPLPPPPPPGSVCAAALCTDPEVRALFSAQGIAVNKADCATESQTDCTSLNQLPSSTVARILAMKADNPTCLFTITGGTEAGHSSHGHGKPIVDFRLDNCLISSLVQRTKYGIVSIGAQKGTTQYSAVGANFDDPGSAHFHVKFSP